MTVGRFAPSPTGRMHLGNIFTALLSWLSAKKKGGKWILRIEDLDRRRSKSEYAEMIEDDLRWLGLEWDEGGLEGKGDAGPYCQSLRSEFYEKAFNLLSSKGLIYPCTCTRADIHAAGAPQQGDTVFIYPGTCRPPRFGGKGCNNEKPVRNYRLFVEDKKISFVDRIYGPQTVSPAHEFGDFIIRRDSDEWAYQLAVVVDDAAMGVTEVVRGSDLLSSVGAQIYLYNLLNLPVPEFMHVPLICNEKGIRLSKRDASLSMEAIRKTSGPSHVIGFLGCLAGILPEPFPISANGLLNLYDPSVIRPVKNLIIN